ncbi:UNVERIFIED_CONTAM: putative sugar phosphate/phosphate translocator [Sesamum latifolium]|uniref:Sugar phosphate/phosphate translocator n=1 Tax=Sesamum latifolium TaxID=2727402 RepID=A0AAW2SP98_9LAMI
MGKGGALSDGVVKKIILSYTYVAIWIFLSFTVIVYNKYILDKKLYNWPFPISLTMIHMAFCSSLAFAAVRIFKLVEPAALSRRVYLSSVVPIGALSTPIPLAL